MCPACRQRTRNVYRLGWWFFGGLALAFAMGTPLIVITEARRFGAAAAFDALVILAGATSFLAGLAWLTRRAAADIQ